MDGVQTITGLNLLRHKPYQIDDYHEGERRNMKTYDEMCLELIPTKVRVLNKAYRMITHTRLKPIVMAWAKQ